MRTYFHSRAFIMSFFITLLLIVFVIGIFVVDAEGRRLSFNDTAPPFEVIYHKNGEAQIQVNAFSLNRRFRATGLIKVWHFLADFFCIPHGRFPDAENGG